MNRRAAASNQCHSQFAFFVRAARASGRRATKWIKFGLSGFLSVLGAACGGGPASCLFLFQLSPPGLGIFFVFPASSQPPGAFSRLIFHLSLLLFTSAYMAGRDYHRKQNTGSFGVWVARTTKQKKRLGNAPCQEPGIPLLLVALLHSLSWGPAGRAGEGRGGWEEGGPFTPEVFWAWAAGPAPLGLAWSLVRTRLAPR
jgi:hypothetical protein